MTGIFKKLFGGGKASAQAADEPAIEYNGFKIVPSPQEGDGGWSTEAKISKEVDGETKIHHFIRADKTGSRDGAVELTLNKCRQTIDQLGDRIFG
jgi:hypothetical protein